MSRRRDHRVRDNTTCPDQGGCRRLYHARIGGPEVGDVCECCGEEITDALTTDDPVCKCKDQLIDHVRRTVGHPYTACPFFGTLTPLAGKFAVSRLTSQEGS